MNSAVMKEKAEKRLPEGWQVVKFGEIAKHISKRVEPTETDLDIYVGLEHLDPDSLRIKRHGVPSDVAGQKLLVKKGQIIFGKRRVYQRKLAVADWECICSAHAMVLEEIAGMIVPGFLPYFMQSDLFMSRALSVSSGSLSPTIKWKDLSHQEFFIPPIAEQQRLLPVLRSIDLQVEQLLQAFGAARKAMRVLSLKVFANYFDVAEKKRERLPSGWNVRCVSDLLVTSPQSGLSPKELYKDSGFYVLNLNCLSSDGFVSNDYKNIDESSFSKKALLRDGDLLISRSNAPELVGFVGLYRDDMSRNAIFPDTMWRLNVDESIVSKEYLHNYLLSPYARSEIKRIAAGTSGSMKKINKTSFGAMKIPVPPLPEQALINSNIDGFRSSLKQFQQNIDNIRNLKMGLLHQLLSYK